jgi:uncharacterized alpha-E superfamily protein
MLGKTANGLFWMFRYIERAENTARLVDAGLRMALTRGASVGEEWGSLLSTAGAADAYNEKYDEITAAHVVDFLLRDRDNPSSVRTSIECARNNARLVRTAVTREVWESINQCWMTVTDVLRYPVSDADLPEVLAGIKQDGGLIRGALHGTMLRNEHYDFARIGTFIERADNTTRILDVKYYVLLPSISYVGSALDNFQWESILRSVSAQRSYRWIYGARYQPANIADFLILNGRMPRSLAFSYGKIVNNLDYLAEEYGARHACHETAERNLHRLKGRNIDDIFEHGLHEFLSEFIEDNARLSNEIAEAYLFT